MVLLVLELELEFLTVAMSSGVYCLGFSSFDWLPNVVPAREQHPSPLLTGSQLLLPVVCLEVKSKVQVENN